MHTRTHPEIGEIRVPVGTGNGPVSCELLRSLKRGAWAFCNACVHMFFASGSGVWGCVDTLIAVHFLVEMCGVSVCGLFSEGGCGEVHIFVVCRVYGLFKMSLVFFCAVTSY